MHNTQFHGLCVVPHTPTHIHQKRNEFRNHKLPYHLGSFDTNYIIFIIVLKNIFFSNNKQIMKENIESSRIIFFQNKNFKIN
jgi:hypothetical protein